MDSQRSSQTIEECPICREPITNVMVTNCNHQFCTVCLELNMDESLNCPLCRRIIEKTQCQRIVAEIVGQRGRGRNIRYLVRWEAGHEPAETYEPLTNIANAPRRLAQYRLRRHAVAQQRYRNRLHKRSN